MRKYKGRVTLCDVDGNPTVNTKAYRSREHRANIIADFIKYNKTKLSIYILIEPKIEPENKDEKMDI